jgi:hypothetical protein
MDNTIYVDDVTSMAIEYNQDEPCDSKQAPSCPANEESETVERYSRPFQVSKSLNAGKIYSKLVGGAIGCRLICWAVSQRYFSCSQTVVEYGRLLSSLSRVLTCLYRPELDPCLIVPEIIIRARFR